MVIRSVEIDDENVGRTWESIINADTRLEDNGLMAAAFRWQGFEPEYFLQLMDDGDDYPDDEGAGNTFWSIASHPVPNAIWDTISSLTWGDVETGHPIIEQYLPMLCQSERGALGMGWCATHTDDTEEDDE
jgi:hypothetical protein